MTLHRLHNQDRQLANVLGMHDRHDAQAPAGALRDLVASREVGPRERRDAEGFAVCGDECEPVEHEAGGYS